MTKPLPHPKLCGHRPSAVVNAFNRFQKSSEDIAKKYQCKVSFQFKDPDGYISGEPIVVADGTK